MIKKLLLCILFQISNLHLFPMFDNILYFKYLEVLKYPLCVARIHDKGTNKNKK